MGLECLLGCQSIALAKGLQRPLGGEGLKGQKVTWAGVRLRSVDLTWRSEEAMGATWSDLR